MHAMWKPQKFKLVYLVATLYVLTLTLPSAAAVYWAFGDMLLNHSNAFALLPRTGFRDIAVILMLIHQVRVWLLMPSFSCLQLVVLHTNMLTDINLAHWFIAYTVANIATDLYNWHLWMLQSSFINR